MKAIYYSAQHKCMMYNLLVYINSTMIVYISSPFRRLFLPKNIMQLMTTSDTEEVSVDVASFNKLLTDERETLHIAVRRYNTIEKPTSEEFANVQDYNPHLQIKWPVRKGESQLHVAACGSGFYIWKGSEKALDPEGNPYHGTRDWCIRKMFELNGWPIPENIK